MVLDLLVTRPCVSLVLFLYVFSEDFFRVMTTFYCWSDLCVVRISLKYVTFSGSSCEKFRKVPLCCFHTPPDGKKILKSRLKGLHMFCSRYTILEIYCRYSSLCEKFLWAWKNVRLSQHKFLVFEWNED